MTGISSILWWLVKNECLHGYNFIVCYMIFKIFVAPEDIYPEVLCILQLLFYFPAVFGILRQGHGNLFRDKVERITSV